MRGKEGGKKERSKAGEQRRKEWKKEGREERNAAS